MRGRGRHRERRRGPAGRPPLRLDPARRLGRRGEGGCADLMAVEGVTVEEAGALGRLRDRSRKIRERIPYDSGNYPYVTARVRAKSAALLPADTYARLLQMEIPEIARLLGEREYKSEMLALGARYAGVDLIEHATSLNLTRTYNQIYDFCEGHLREIVGRYLDRFDLQNVKTIVRAKTYGASAEQVEEDLVPAGSLPVEFLRELAAAPTLNDAFRRLDGTIYVPGLDEPGSEVKNWSAWEDRVSRIYYTELLQSVPPSTDANRLMRQFIEREIDIVNLKTLLRVWAAKASFDREIFLPGGFEVPEAELAEMVRLDKTALMARLRAYSFYEDIAGDLERVEATGVGALLRKVEKV